MSEKVDLEALRDIGHAITGRQVVIDIDTYRIILAALEDADRLADKRELRIERVDQAIREVKEENERLRRALARWDEHLPGCEKWRHITERVGSLNVCNGEDVLDDETSCTCGYEGRWEDHL